VFVPGHNLGFISGHIALNELCSREIVGLEKLIAYIIQEFYNLWDLRELYSIWRMPISRTELLPKLRLKIYDIINQISCNTLQDTANALEYWIWQEKQAKFIFNSVRVYDFWGYGWRLPYWDSEIVSFWERVPLCYRLGGKLNDKYVEQIQGAYGISLVEKPDQSFSNYLRSLLTRTGLYETKILTNVKRLPYNLPIISKKKRENAYYNHPLCWYGIVPKDKFIRLYSGGETINSFLALERLNMILL
jgi:asparagine synthase (glutamine-hydrolysing)